MKVGYGDIIATTHMGRVVAVLVMFWGAFINSLILVAMQITSQFSIQEQQAYESFEFTYERKELVESAVKLISAHHAAYKIRVNEGRFAGLSIKLKRYWFGKFKDNLIKFAKQRK